MTNPQQPKKKGLTREEATELYGDLRKALNQASVKKTTRANKDDDKAAAKAIANEISKALRSEGRRAAPSAASPQTEPPSYDPIPTQRPGFGNFLAILLIVILGVGRIALSSVEALGMADVGPRPQVITQVIQESDSKSKEEVRILTSLDSRRAESADRAKLLDEREQNLDIRDREFALRLTQLKELTDKLKIDREKGERKKGQQLEQLANVYGSMSPAEAAQLMEQLDVTIALALIEKMPEKRIGQILALMSKDRALMLTKMLSGKAQG